MTKQQLLIAKPGVILEYIRAQIRKWHGDKVENRAAVFATHGYYCVHLEGWPRPWNVRRGGIPSLVRHIKSTAK